MTYNLVVSDKYNFITFAQKYQDGMGKKDR